jgi:hypothetical protein
MKNTTTTERGVRFLLGTTGNYIFTGLGEFKTIAAAKEKALSQPRNGVVVIYRRADLWRHGVNYGTSLEPVETVKST